MYIHFDDVPDGVEFTIIYPTPVYVKRIIGGDDGVDSQIVASGKGGGVKRRTIDEVLNGYVYIEEVV